jgi:hypothetical protein
MEKEYKPLQDERIFRTKLFPLVTTQVNEFTWSAWLAAPAALDAAALSDDFFFHGHPRRSISNYKIWRSMNSNDKRAAQKNVLFQSWEKQLEMYQRD